MSAEELLKQGDLEAALGSLQDQVRAKPADAELRVFLFQLLAVRGELDRALTQLNVVGDLDSQAYPMVQAYREALRCEAFRIEVFAGRTQPLLFGEPSQWVAHFLEALRLTTQGNFAEANALRNQGFEAMEEVTGNADGNPFAGVIDADSRVGPFLEAIVNGGYYWVPFDRLKSVEIEPPVDLRDLVWAPATFTWQNGGHAVGFVPSRYPGSIADNSADALLCRQTIWHDQGEDTFFGEGQRVLMTDQDEYDFLSLKMLSIDTPAEEAAEA